MRNHDLLVRGAAVLSLVGLAAIAACSSDDSTDDGYQGDDAGASSPDSGKDSAGGDTGSHDATPGADTSTPDTSTPDSSGTDADQDTGTDSGPLVDSGTDSGEDAGIDTGAPDTGIDTGVDAGEDAGIDAGEDAGEDTGAPDGGQDADVPDTSVIDSGPPVGFTNPVQIDVGSTFNANTIVTTATGGPTLTPLDGAGNSNDFPTQAKATALGATGVGLPNDGFFASNGTTIPNVQLRWSDGSNTMNSIVVAANLGTTYQFNVPSAQYEQLQIYATGGNGSSTLSYTITYATGTPTTATTPIPDWCIPGPLATGEYSLATVHRVSGGNNLDTSIRCGLYAINLNPDAARAVTQVSFSASGSATSYLVFYGATAW